MAEIKIVEYAGLEKCGACGTAPLMNAEDDRAQVVCFCGVRGQAVTEEVNPDLSPERRIELAAITWNAMWRRGKPAPAARRLAEALQEAACGLDDPEIAWVNRDAGVGDAFPRDAVRDFLRELDMEPAPDA